VLKLAIDIEGLKFATSSVDIKAYLKLLSETNHKPNYRWNESMFKVRKSPSRSIHLID